MEYRKYGEAVYIRLDRGDEILGCVLEACKAEGILSATFSGIGGCSEARIQTFIPEHYIMNLAAAQDYKGFYNEEIAIHRAMIFPPLCDMCIFCFSANEDITVRLGAEGVLRLSNGRLREIQPKTPVRVLGPVRCSYGRINGKYRYRIIMKCKNTAEMRGFISGILTESAKLKEMRNTSLYADMNGDVGV
jgi:primosomal protein N' (replication factor Y)